MISIVAAISKNNVIGKNNKLPWHLPEDLERFKKLTLGKNVLMGRKTYESILGYLGKPLQGRTSIVITSDKNYKAAKGVKIYHSLESALNANKDVFCIGGAMIYKEIMDKANRLYITHIEKNYEGDAFFPEIDPAVWRLSAEVKNDGFTFSEYERKNS